MTWGPSAFSGVVLAFCAIVSDHPLDAIVAFCSGTCCALAFAQWVSAKRRGGRQDG